MLGQSRCTEGLVLLQELANHYKSDLQEIMGEWLKAVAEIESEESEQTLLSFIEEKADDFAISINLKYHKKFLAKYISELARTKPKIEQDIIRLCNKSLPPTKRDLLSEVVKETGTSKAILAGLNLINDATTPAIPHYLMKAIENTFVERCPNNEIKNSYTLAPRSCNEVRAKLFEMAMKDNHRAQSAFTLLGQIEVWRMQYGKPNDEPRHPAIDSGKPWPPINSETIGFDQVNDVFNQTDNVISEKIVERHKRLPVPEIDNTRKTVTKEQQAILSLIWQHFCEHNEWPPAIVLYKRFGKPTTDLACETLGKHVTSSFSIAGQRKVYLITFLGILLTDKGQELEQLIFQYLDYVKAALELNPNIRTINSVDVEKAIGLTSAQSMVLRHLLSFSWFMNGGHISGNQWSAGLPDDIDEIFAEEDITKYFIKKVIPTLGSKTKPDVLNPLVTVNNQIQLKLNNQTKVNNEAAQENVMPENKIAKLSKLEFIQTIEKKLNRNEVKLVWYELFSSNMDDELPNRTFTDCIMELRIRADKQGILSKLYQTLIQLRSDLENPH